MRELRGWRIGAGIWHEWHALFFRPMLPKQLDTLVRIPSQQSLAISVSHFFAHFTSATTTAISTSCCRRISFRVTDCPHELVIGESGWHMAKVE